VDAPVLTWATGLLIAGRLHGYRRTQKEVIRAVRICDLTLRKRFVLLMLVFCAPLRGCVLLSGAYSPAQIDRVREDARQRSDPSRYRRMLAALALLV
jgi:transcription initiation factor TFIIIB Brf1 subunit/transcription initiation factor TFIIB